MIRSLLLFCGSRSGHDPAQAALAAGLGTLLARRGVTLVDGANKKKYFVVRDTDTNCLCSRDIKDIAPKSRVNLWAKFPAPPDDVQKISIVIPHFGPIDDVSISR